MRAIFLASLFTLSIYSVALAGEIQVDRVSTAELDRVGRLVRVSVKAEVSNPGPAGRAFIKIAGKDSAGFEIARVTLSGEIAGDDHKTLTNTVLVAGDNLTKITTWEPIQANVYPMR